MKKRVMIVDGLNQFLRSFIIDPTLSNGGKPVGGICGFFKSLQKMNRELKPDRIIVVWDGTGGSKRRKSLHKGYKEGRKPVRLNRNLRLTPEEEQENRSWQQFRLIELINTTPIVQTVEDGVEADDIIALITKFPEFKGWNKFIVSADKDFIQLCDDETILFRPIQKEVLNAKRVVEKFGIHPTNFALARAMAGDPSDNLPGIGGVGLKTVAKRLPFLMENKEYHLKDVEKFCEKTDSASNVYGKILESLDVIAFNYKIMQLYAPSISLKAVNKVKNTFAEYEPLFNQTEFTKMSIKDGFGHISFEEIFRTFRKMVEDDKEDS
jgi:DNA polymerase-1